MEWAEETRECGKQHGTRLGSLVIGLASNNLDIAIIKVLGQGGSPHKQKG